MIAAPLPTCPEREALLGLIRQSRSPLLRPMGVWAEQEIVLPTGPCAGRRFSLDRQPYSRLLLDSLPKWNRSVVTGPTQSGKTLTAFVIPTMYHLFEMGESVICGLPTMDMSGDKWDQDLRPVIESSQYREFLPRRGSGSRGGTPTSISFTNGTTLKFMAGGGGDKQRAGYTARVLIITETDGMDEAGEASREADKITQLEARTRAYGDRARIYMECTLSTTEGRTWQEYEAGSASRIIVPCPHCGEWVSPEREHFVGWSDAATELDAKETGHFQCPSCEKALTEEDRVSMNRSGRLLHAGQEVAEGGVIVGATRRTGTLGFRWSAFNNLLYPTNRIASDEWKSERSEDRENVERALKQQVWCIPVQEDKIETGAISAAIVRGSHSEYKGRMTGLQRRSVPDDAKGLTVAVDVHTYHKRLIYYVVCAWLSDNRCVVVDYGQFGDPNLLDVVGSERSAEMNLRDLRVHWETDDGAYRKADGTRVHFDAGLIDYGYLPSVVTAVVRDFGTPWRAAKGLGENIKGASSYLHPVNVTNEKRPSANGDMWYEARQSGGIWTINMHADHWKSIVHDSFVLKPLDDDGVHRSGAIRLFGADSRDHFQFGDEVTAEVLQREFKDKAGYVTKWVKRGRSENHYFDCMYMNYVAASVAGLTLTRKKERPRITLSQLKGNRR